MNIKNALRLVLLLTGMTTLLASCAPVQASKPQFVGAAVRSINYGGKEVVLLVRDPKDKSNGSGGDSLNPYSAGGTICCFSIPLVWHPGLQVIVRYEFYPDPTWHEQVVDVPPYPDGIAGDIWLAMHEDGRAEAVVSSFGPTRPEWPGRVKGRPIQSAEYATKLKNKRLAYQRAILEKIEQGLKDDMHKMNEEKIETYRSVIDDTKNQIRLLEQEL